MIVHPSSSTFGEMSADHLDLFAEGVDEMNLSNIKKLGAINRQCRPPSEHEISYRIEF